MLSQFASAYEDCLYLQSFFNIIDKKAIQQGNKQLRDKIKNIEFRNVTFYYPNCNNPVLRNINLTLYPNKTYAIVGLNGSGKTTLIKLLCNLYQPNFGQIFINGIDINLYDSHFLFEHISVLFQDYVRYPLTIRENIGIGNLEIIRDDDYICESAGISEIDQFICNLPQGLDTTVSKGWSDGTELSGGQWQRLAIARALVKGGDLLIFDEPDASLDVSIQEKLFNKVKELNANRIFVFTSHRVENLQIADEIIVLDKGKIDSIGQHSDLIQTSNVYQNICKMNAHQRNS